MTDRQLFFYYLVPQSAQLAGTSASAPRPLFFSTEKKLEKFREEHPDQRQAQWGMSEISLKVAKELIRLSKKKVKRRCEECGR